MLRWAKCCCLLLPGAARPACRRCPWQGLRLGAASSTAGGAPSLWKGWRHVMWRHAATHTKTLTAFGKDRALGGEGHGWPSDGPSHRRFGCFRAHAQAEEGSCQCQLVSIPFSSVNKKQLHRPFDHTRALTSAHFDQESWRDDGAAGCSHGDRCPDVRRKDAGLGGGRVVQV